jgi:hypothetical protein
MMRDAQKCLLVYLETIRAASAAYCEACAATAHDASASDALAKGKETQEALCAATKRQETVISSLRESAKEDGSSVYAELYALYGTLFICKNVCDYFQ